MAQSNAWDMLSARQLAPLHLVNLTSQFWVFNGVGYEERCPLAMGFRLTYILGRAKLIAEDRRHGE
jgi:hypothetical protein